MVIEAGGLCTLGIATAVIGTILDILASAFSTFALPIFHAVLRTYYQLAVLDFLSYASMHGFARLVTGPARIMRPNNSNQWLLTTIWLVVIAITEPIDPGWPG